MAREETLLERNLRIRGEQLKADLEGRAKDLEHLKDAVDSARKAGIEDESLTRLLNAAKNAVDTVLGALGPAPPPEPTVKSK